MRLAARILFVALALRQAHCSPAASVQFEGGYKLPRDIQDGLYHATVTIPSDISENLSPGFGNAVQIANITNNATVLDHYRRRRSNEVRASINARDSYPDAPPDLPVDNYYCNLWDVMDPAHYLRAFVTLPERCDQGEKISKHSILFAKYGSAIVYGCSFGGVNPCSGHELHEFEWYINKKCESEDMVGYVDMSHWKKRYGRADFESYLCKYKLSQ